MSGGKPGRKRWIDTKCSVEARGKPLSAAPCCRVSAASQLSCCCSGWAGVICRKCSNVTTEVEKVSSCCDIPIVAKLVCILFYGSGWKEDDENKFLMRALHAAPLHCDLIIYCHSISSCTVWPINSYIVEHKFATCQRDAVRVYKPKQSIGFFSNPRLTFILLTRYDLPRDFLEVVGIDWIEIGITWLQDTCFIDKIIGNVRW